MNTTDPVALPSAIHASIPQHERLRIRQHSTNTNLLLHDGLKTRQCPQNIVCLRYDWLQFRSPYQNKAVRPDPSTGSGQGTLRVLKGEHLIVVGIKIVAEVTGTNNTTGLVALPSAIHASIPQHERLKATQHSTNTILLLHDWLQSRSPYQNKAVRPEVSKGEHLIFFGIDTVEEVEALRLILEQTEV